MWPQIIMCFLFQLYMAPVSHPDRYSDSVEFWRDVYGIDSKYILQDSWFIIFWEFSGQVHVVCEISSCWKKNSYLYTFLTCVCYILSLKLFLWDTSVENSLHVYVGISHDHIIFHLTFSLFGLMICVKIQLTFF